MATMCSRFLRGCNNLSFCNFTAAVNLVGARTLYSATALGIDAFLRVKERTQQHFVQIDDKFKQKMNEFSAPGSSNMVFTEDLKNMIYLADGSEADMTLLERMIIKFNQQNKDLRFGSFVFGPVVMRMYYNLNKPLEALKLIKNPELDGFFDQIMTFQVLLDLFYNNKMYDEVIEIFEILKKKQLSGTKFHRHPLVIVTAACYQKNTPEAFEYVKQLWKEMQEVGHVPMNKTVTFAAGLAIAQNSPHIALEMLSLTSKQNYVTVRNLKVAALADLNRPEDALPILRRILEFDLPVERKQTFSEEAMEKLRLSVQRSGNKDLETEFNRIDQQLTVQGHIAAEPLSKQLCTEMHYNPTMPPGRKEDRRLAASFGMNHPRQQQTARRREGLADIV
ncbi:pentatricopeptide repeat-containing protein 2, mitochondrial-like [Lycorma delicatula]|uniref:pentatricopeptide repeat-containing protein 2, mitochondrial-like n=1 Tax=Lycorma delicatula TaxID=130591 RepID=UPI003F51013D